MKCKRSVTAFLLCISFTTYSLADSTQNASGASAHASKALGMGIAASGQVTLGVSAVPMLSVGAVSHAVGAVGTVSTAAGKSSAAAAGLTPSSPLPVTDETITVFSPAEALKQRTSTTPR